MSLLALQIKNEYTYSSKHTVETVKAEMLELEDYVHDYTKAILEYFSVYDFTYQLKDGTEKIHVTKQERYSYMQSLSYEEVHEMAWELVVLSTLVKEQTFTAIVGKFYKRLPHEPRLNLETTAELLGVLSTTPFIDVVYPNYSFEGVLIVKSNIEHDQSTKDYLNNQLYILPSLVPPKKIISNSMCGYQTIKGSIMTKGKHHDKPMNINHLNRQNAIPLIMDERVYRMSEPVFKDKDGETKEERSKRLKDWRQLNHECIGVYAKFVATPFYLTNKYDERGRFYTQGHHFNVQGDDYRKGSIEFADKELIEG